MSDVEHDSDDDCCVKEEKPIFLRFFALKSKAFQIVKKNKWGMEQDRLFKFDMLSRTLQTFDLKMECKSEYRLAVITEARITIPTDFFGNPVSIEKATEVVLYFCDREPYTLLFQDNAMLLEFSEYISALVVKLQLEEKCRFHQSLELDWDVVGPPGRDWTPAMSPAEYVKRRALVLNYDKPLEISIGPSTFNFGTATDAPKPTVAPPTSSLTSGMHKRNSSTMNLDSSEQYTVLKENRFGFSQERILTVGKHPTPTLRVLDLSKRIHKQIALGDLFQLEVSGVDSADVSAESEVQKSEKMSRLQFVFAGDQRPFSVIFQSSTLCVAFCDRVHQLNPNVIVIKSDESSVGNEHQKDPNFLRFPVYKLGTLGVKIRRLIYIYPKLGLVRSVNEGVSYTDHTLATVLRIQKPQDDSLKAIVSFDDKEHERFILHFDTAFARDQFLGRVFSLSLLGSRFMSNSTPFVTTQVRKQSIRFLPAHTPSPPIASDGVVHVSTIVQRLAAANLSDQADTATVSSLLSPTPKTPLDLMAIASIPESEEVDMSRKSTPSPSPTAIPGPALDAEYDKLLSSYDLLKGPHSIFTGTWNVGNGPFPAAQPLHDWIPLKEFDIYAIGLQECSSGDRNSWVSGITNLVCGSEEPVYFDNESDAGANHVAWLNSFIDKHEYGTHSEPNQNQQYLCLGVVALWEMVLLVYIKSSLAPRISNVMTSTCATGVGDVLGNKGGAALSFSLDDSRVCFINSHLAARKERLLQRRQNYVKILRELKLGVPENSDLLHWFHHVIWLGDLNYRVTREWDGALLLVEKQNWRRLMLFDQMRQEMLKLSVFGGFDEGPVNFAPTYRWEKKSNAFSNKRFQSPSWTDRVVTHSFPDSGELVTTALSAVHHIHSSDHRPVFAHLSLTSRPFHHYFVPPTHTHKVRISIGGIRWQLVDKQQCESIFQHSQAVLATFSGAFLEQSMTSTIPIEKVDFQNCAALFPQNIELSLNVHDLPYLVDQHLLLTVYSSQQTSTYTNFQTHNPVSSAADVSAPQTITESRRFLKSQIQSTALLSGLHSNQKDANKDPVSTLQPHLSGESAPEQSSSTSEIIGHALIPLRDCLISTLYLPVEQQNNGVAVVFTDYTSRHGDVSGEISVLMTAKIEHPDLSVLVNQYQFNPLAQLSRSAAFPLCSQNFPPAHNDETVEFNQSFVSRLLPREVNIPLHCADSEIVSTLTPQAQSAAKSAMMAASLAAIQAKSPEAQEREAKKMQAKLNSLPKAESNATETTVSDNPAIDVTALVNQLDPLTNAAAPPLSTQWQRVYHFRSDSQLENSFNNPRHCQLPCVGVPELVEVRRLRGPNTPTLFAHEPRDVSAVENTEKVSSVTINDVSTTAETTVSMESVMPRLQRAKSHTIAPVLRRADLASGSVSFELSSDTSIPLANASPVSPDIEEQDLEDDEFDAQSAQTIALELVARPINDDSDDD